VASNLDLLVALVAALPVAGLSLPKTLALSGEEVAATFTGDVAGGAWIPACRPVQIERFDEVRSRWVAVGTQGCPDSRPAIALQDGAVLKTKVEADRFSIFRFVLTYGVGCNEGLPLELAGCREFRSVVSGNLSVQPAQPN
jgi:hypothetical protein